MSSDGPRFRDLFREHYSYVCRSLLRLGVGDSEVEDLAQDVFVAVHGRLRDYDPRRPIRPWLFAFAVRRAANHRRLARHKNLPLPAAVSGGKRPMTELEARQAVLVGLRHLSLDHRSVLILVDLEGLTAPEVAQALGIPRNTVYSRLRAARVEFRRVFDRDQSDKRDTGGTPP